jgi:hypothetical protein
MDENTRLIGGPWMNSYLRNIDLARHTDLQKWEQTAD